MNSPLNQLLTAEDILDTVREPLVVLDADLRVMMANQSFYQSFRVTPENTQGQLLYDLGDRQWDIPALRKLLEEVLPQNAVFNDYEVDHTFPDIGHRMMLLNARRLDHSKLILLAIKDVTERKQGEGELRRSNARNELILAGTEAATWDWNIPDKRVLFSRRWKQLRGFSEAEVGDSEVEWSDRIHPDDKVRVLEAVAAHLAGQTPLFDEEYRVRHKSGHWIWILDRGVITARDASGNVLHMMGCETDITVRKQAEEELRQSRERLAATQTHAPVGIVETTLDGAYVSVNDEFCRIAGYSKDELLKMRIHDVTHPEDWPENHDRFRRLVAGEYTSYRFEKRFVRKDGSITWADVVRRLLTDAQGTPLYVIGAILDITQRKQADTALRRNTALFSEIIEQAPGGVYVVDAQFRVAHMNAQSLPFFASVQPLIGRDFDEVLQIVWGPEMGPQCASIFRHTLATGERYVSPRFSGQRHDIGVDQAFEFETQRITLPDGQHGVVCYFQDVTAQDRAEAALRLMNERLTLAVKCSQVVLFQQDLELRYTWLQNPVPGFEDSVAIGKRDADLMERAEDAAMTEALKREVIRSGVSQRQEVLVQIAGVDRHYDLLVEPQRDAAGLISGVTCAAIDITERTQAEEALEKSEQHLRYALQAAAAGAWDWDIGSGDIVWSLENYLLYDLDPAQGPPRYADWECRVHPEDRDRVNENVRAVLDASEAEFRTEFRVVSRQGEVRWLLGLGRVERDGDGQPLRMSGLNLNITERKRAEVALRESEERLRLALSGGKMGMWEWDMPSGLCVWNAMEHELLGLNVGDCRPSTELYFRHVHPDDLTRLRRSLDEVTPERPDWNDEFRIIRADGALRWVAALGKTQYDADGRPERMVGVNFDITERKQAEEALRQAHAQLNDRAGHLELLVQQRTAKLQTAIGELEAFSYSVAHDLRAPLRAMEGYARELLKEPSLSAEGQTYLVRIERAAARMDRLTQDVLAYSRISQERIKLAAVDLDRLAHELVEQYPGITAHCERIAIQSPLLPVLGHEGLLTQALSNLLTNACKFVAPGASPEVVVGTEPIGEEVRIWVGDKGIGIAAEHRHRIFEMFGFGRIHPDHKYEGTGIGLAIVKKAAERMGGTVGFDSEPGKGSRFWIQLNRSNP